jgi:hypothetical protein
MTSAAYGPKTHPVRPCWIEAVRGVRAVLRFARRPQCGKKRGVDSVHTLGFRFGCTGLGLGRIGDVFERVADLQGQEPGSSPTSGTVFSPIRGH